MNLRRVILTLMSAVVLLVTGCQSDASKDEEVNALFGELMKRPHIEAMEADYLGMMATIRDTLIAEIGVEPWAPAREPISGSGCGGDLASLRGDGAIRRYSSGASPGNIADSDWPRALKLVTELANEQGFGAPQVVVDRPGDHEVSLKDAYGAELLFGTAVNTTLSVSTGCHLTREAYERGTPEDEPLY